MGHANGKPSDERYRRKVLIPLGVTLVCFTLLFVYVGNRFLHSHLDDSLDQQLNTVDILFPALIEERSQLMAAALTQIARDQGLQAAFKDGDRDGLLIRAAEIFAPLRFRHRITHFYVHTADKVNFLRVHQPQRYGDPIERHTLDQAAASGQISAGIELGPLGTFTLRTVLPWQRGDRLLGYLELGEEIDHIIRTLREAGKVELLITIDKDYLERAGWEEGMRMLGRPAEWDLFPQRVIIENTLPGLPAELAQAFTRAELPEGQQIDLRLGERTYRSHYLPLRDAGNRVVGEILVATDTTGDLSAFRHDMAWLTALLVFLGASLFFSAFTALGRADRQLALSRRSLRAQMEDTRRAKEHLEVEVGQRRRAEASLRAARDELEQRVIERTAQLNEAFTAARQSRDRIDVVLRSVTDILFVTDEEDRILTLNDAAEELLGSSRDEIAGLRVDSAIRDVRLLEEVRAAISGRQAADFDLEVPERDRQPARIVYFRTSPVGSGERPGGMVFLGQDVTDHRLLDRLKSEFISTAAHELRTPMAAILGFAELLRNGDFTPAERRDFLEVIHEKADYLSSLLDDLLDVSRIESGKPLDIVPSPQQVEQLIEPPVRHYRIAAKTHTIECRLDQPQLELLADRDRIAQVMENLLNNAVKYSPQGGTIKVTGELGDEGFYRITVEDQGIGMTREETGRAFEKFYRADATDAAIKGTGLGLTIVKAIVETHGGRVWLESEWGKGTTACFTLPVA